MPERIDSTNHHSRNFESLREMRPGKEESVGEKAPMRAVPSEDCGWSDADTVTNTGFLPTELLDREGLRQLGAGDEPVALPSCIDKAELARRARAIYETAATDASLTHIDREERGGAAERIESYVADRFERRTLHGRGGDGVVVSHPPLREESDAEPIISEAEVKRRLALGGPKLERVLGRSASQGSGPTFAQDDSGHWRFTGTDEGDEITVTQDDDGGLSIAWRSADGSSSESFHLTAEQLGDSHPRGYPVRFDLKGGDDKLTADESVATELHVIGGDGDDEIIGGASNDILFGGAGDDVIRGGAGCNAIQGDAGADALYGGSDHDNISADKADRLVDAGKGDGVHDLIVGCSEAQVRGLGSEDAVHEAELSLAEEFRAPTRRSSSTGQGIAALRPASRRIWRSCCRPRPDAQTSKRSSASCARRAVSCAWSSIPAAPTACLAIEGRMSWYASAWAQRRSLPTTRTSTP